MKKILLSFLALGAFFASTAFGELKVVTVSVQQLFDGYYKSAEAEQKLTSVREQAVEEAKVKQQELQGMADAIRLMQEEMENPMLSDDAKADKLKELEAKAQEGRAKQAEFQQWEQRTANDLQVQSQQIRATIIDEIIKVVNEVALKDYAADLVFDTSDILGSGVPTVLFADSKLDVTAKILAELNKNAPNN